MGGGGSERRVTRDVGYVPVAGIGDWELGNCDWDRGWGLGGGDAWLGTGTDTDRGVGVSGFGGRFLERTRTEGRV